MKLLVADDDMSKSITDNNCRKPFKKPHKDFPLFPHATGRWAKKVRQKLHYFGRCADDPDGSVALAIWLEQKDDLLAGRTPLEKTDKLTLRELCNRFLTAKEALVESGELAQRTFDGYYRVCDRLIDAFGKHRPVVSLRPTDFSKLRAQLGKGLGPVAVGGIVTVIRMVFKWAYDSELTERPIRFGPDFKRPSKKTLRIDRSKKGKKLFEAAQIRAMLNGVLAENGKRNGITETVQIDGASPQLRAMILLGINCGLGNSDLGKLPLDALHLQQGWLEFPRPKTGIERRCKLWPETIEALKKVIGSRPVSVDPEAADLVFITKYGQCWAKDTPDSPISKETRKLLDRLGIYRPGLSFYALRHTFETIAGETKDQVAVNAVMGHVDDSMAAVYRERISDERLEAVSDFVHDWLFPEAKNDPPGQSKEAKE